MAQFESIHSLAQTVTPGTVLFEEGTAGGGIVILLKGRLDVLREGARVGTIDDPGSYVGESAFVTGGRRTATVVAQTSATVIRLNSQQAANFLATKGAEAKLVRNVTDRLNDASEKLVLQERRIAALEAEREELLQGMADILQQLGDDTDVAELGVLAKRGLSTLYHRYKGETTRPPSHTRPPRPND